MHMRRFLIAIVLSVAWVLVGHTLGVHALSSDPKQFINADNTFYAYVNGGETIGASFTRVDQYSTTVPTVTGTVTVTLDGPGIKQQTCSLPVNIPVGQGCQFATQTASASGIWRIQFIAPPDAKPYAQVSPTVRWVNDMFSWNITVSAANGEQHGRVWTESYALRQPAPASFVGNFVYYYVSEDGYVYKSTEFGYNGEASILSADAIGIRQGDQCVSAYQSIDTSNTQYSPALGTCGDVYKLFFEQPAGNLPTQATQWDGKTGWVLPNVSPPVLSELHFTADSSQDQQSGTISFFLHHFIGQYQIKIDVNNDGNFDEQSDVTMNEQMQSLSDGLQQIQFQGADRQGQIIPRSQPIGIEILISKVAEIHLVASDVEGRTGGLELIRLSGDNAPTTRMCWNDTNLDPLTDTTLMTPKPDGRNCPDSTGGVHGWLYANDSWGNNRYIDDWTYASANLQGNNKITYQQSLSDISKKVRNNFLLISAVVGILVVVIAAGITFAVIRSRKKPLNTILPPPLPGIQPSQTQDPNGPPPDSDPNRY